MILRIKESLKNINFQLFFALLLIGVIPTIYTTFRVFLVGQLPNEYAYSIAGQLTWINLMYEVVKEAIILPLFFFIGNVINDKNELTNRIKTGILLSFTLYAFLSLVIIIFTPTLLTLMATDTSILVASVQYIRIESIANTFSILVQFLLIVFISIDKRNYLYLLTFTQLLLCFLFDSVLVSTSSYSFQMGVNGIGISNILVYLVLLVISIFLLKKEKIDILNKDKANYSWIKDFFKVGGISGVESLVRNLAYMIMISRMVNMVGE